MAEKNFRHFRPALTKAQKLRRKNQLVVMVGEVVGPILNTPKLRLRLMHEKIFRQWRKIVGGGLLDKCQPTRIKRGILYIDVKNSSWAHQLIYMQEEIITRVNELAGAILISSVHCRAVKAGKLKKVAVTTKKDGVLQSGALVSAVEEQNWRQETETRVSDPELVEIICQMRVHSAIRQRMMEKSQ
ncbi:MAG: DUF721 domain-containing protein [Pseudomonadota bacterium]|nr:DUF721 domain-containing protein [Pseudomonadota bacterium]